MMRHKLVMIASQVEHFTTGDRTNILFACQCGCGKVRTQTLDGGWTPEALAEAFRRVAHRAVSAGRARVSPFPGGSAS